MYDEYSSTKALYKMGGSVMKDKTIYILFMNTGTYLSKLIHLYTKKPLNHVSIAFDEDLTRVYSFGRKQPRNPFSGGFVQEDIRSKFLKHSECALYTFRLTEAEYNEIETMVKQFEKDQDRYRYNFLGLIAFLFKIKLQRKHAYFCSQFVATLLYRTESFQPSKPACFTKPEDIRNQTGMKLVYYGRLGEYRKDYQLQEPEVIDVKSSFIFSLRNKVKQLVIR